MNPKKIIAIITTLVLVLATFVSLAACNNVEVTSVDLEKSAIFLNIGEKETLTYTVLPVSAASAQASWISSNSSIATVSNGTVTGISEGTAAVRVTVGGKSSTCNVTVTDPNKAPIPVTGITLNRQTLSLEAGQSKTLVATLEPANATNKTVKWESANPAVVTVNANGLVTAVKSGSTVVTASANGFSADCVVTVMGGGAATNNELYVGKVASLEGRENDFIMAIDASEVPSIEAARKAYNEPLYKNFDGVEEDVFKILKNSGVTDIRIRIWNDPTDGENSYGGGNCDLANAIKISQRCAAAGLGVIIDFHYSDFWADPGKQTIPKAWKGLSTTQVAEEIYKFTKESLEEIQKTNVKITMVQVGNETTGGLAGASTTWSASDSAVVCNYINQGSKAVRDVTGRPENGGAKVAVHFTNAGGNTYLSKAARLDANNVDYDVFGTSWYPYYSSHGSLSGLTSQLRNVHNSYGKDVMVLETAYAWTQEDLDGCGNTAFETSTQPITVQGMSNAIRDVIVAIADLGSWGLGVSYWGGIWISASTSTSGSVNRARCLEYGCGWATHYAKGYDKDANDGGTMVDNNAFFTSDGTPLECLNVFKYVYEGHTVNITADYLYDQEVYCTVGLGEIELPETVTVILNNGSKQTVPAIWAVEQSDLVEYINAVNMYDIQGTTRYGGVCHVYVWVMNVNLLTDGSFEDTKGYPQTDNLIQSAGELGDWKIKYTRATSALQLYVSNESQNARMGTNSFHFWDSGTVDFELYQTLDVSKLSEFGNGSYGCSFDFQGNDGANLDIYAFITVTYKDGTTKTFDGNRIEMQGWQKWARTSVSGVELDLANVASVTVGIHVYAEVSGAGPWGNIDNAQFYFEG